MVESIRVIAAGSIICVEIKVDCSFKYFCIRFIFASILSSAVGEFVLASLAIVSECSYIWFLIIHRVSDFREIDLAHLI
jgi:hypothetical protein